VGARARVQSNWHLVVERTKRRQDDDVRCIGHGGLTPCDFDNIYGLRAGEPFNSDKWYTLRHPPLELGSILPPQIQNLTPVAAQAPFRELERSWRTDMTGLVDL
jgi:hypothetical protein